VAGNPGSCFHHIEIRRKNIQKKEELIPPYNEKLAQIYIGNHPYVAFTGVGAQIKSTYTGGLHISTMTLKAEGLNSRPSTPFGIHFGFVFEIPVIRGFTFQPGVLFSAKGRILKSIL